MAQSTPGSNDRILGALSHTAILISGIGAAVPAMIWASEGRGKSKYLVFQSLQALGYQVLQALVLTLLALVYLIAAGVVVVIDRTGVQPGLPLRTGAVAGLAVLTVIFLVVLLAYVAAALVGAVQCLRGKDFKYPWLGERLERYLAGAKQASDSGDRENRWAAAVAHSSIMMMGTGWIIPALFWIHTGKGGDKTLNSAPAENAWLRFQAVQSLVYQGIGAAAGLLAGAGWLAAGVFLFGFAFYSPQGGMFDSQAADLAALAPFAFLTLVGAGLILLWPLYSTLPLIAAYRILEGKEYDYPLIGRPLRRRLLPGAQAAFRLEEKESASSAEQPAAPGLHSFVK